MLPAASRAKEKPINFPGNCAVFLAELPGTMLRIALFEDKNGGFSGKKKQFDAKIAESKSKIVEFESKIVDFTCKGPPFASNSTNLTTNS